MASITEDTMRDTYSFNLNDIIQESFESSSLTNNYRKIKPKYINKKGNMYNRAKSTFNIHKIINNRYRDNLNNSRSTNQSEESKTKFFMKENKENQVSLFNNSFIREKQRIFRINSVKIKNYDLHLKYNNEIKDCYKIVNNDINLFKTFLAQTRSNFNNKYKIIYSISDLKQKGQKKKIFDTIRKHQNRSCFTKFLEKKINKRCLSSKSIIKQDDNFNPNNLSASVRLNKILLNKNTSNTSNFWKNIEHNNKLIKVKTLAHINNKICNLIKKNSNIFYNNNIFFKTMPIKSLINRMDNYIL